LKYVKVLVLAAFAALAVMSFAGAGSASATVLCKENASPCPEEKLYEAGETLKGTAENTVITASPTITCTHSETTAEVTSPGGEGEAVTGTITALSFTGCKADTIFNPNCVVSVNGLPYHAEVVGSGGNGTILVGGASAGVVCAGIINCVFGNELFELPLTGGNPAKITASNVFLEKESGLLCPGEGLWDATFKAVAPNTAAWVVTE
jgi:hypothetical protein